MARRTRKSDAGIVMSNVKRLVEGKEGLGVKEKPSVKLGAVEMYRLPQRV